MPESSVKITLGVELDKSSLERQLEELKETVRQYSLELGINNQGSGGETNQDSSDRTKKQESSNPQSNKGGLDGVASSIKETARQVQKEVSETLVSIVDLPSVVEKIGDKIVDAVTEVLEKIKQEVSSTLKEEIDDFLQPILNSVDSGIGKIKESVLELISQLFTELNRQDKPNSSAVIKVSAGRDSSITEAIGSGASSIISAINDLANRLSEYLNKISSEQIPEIIDELGFNFLKTLLTGAVERVGGGIAQPVAGGLTNLVRSLVSGQLTEDDDPLVRGSQDFLEGFNADGSVIEVKIYRELLEAKQILEQILNQSKEQLALDAVTSAGEITGNIQSLVRQITGEEAPDPNEGMLDKILSAIAEIAEEIRTWFERLNPSGGKIANTSRPGGSGGRGNDDDIIDVEFTDVTPKPPSSPNGGLAGTQLLLPGSNDDLTEAIDTGLGELIRSNEELISLSREAVIKERVNIPRVTGDSVLNTNNKSDGGAGGAIIRASGSLLAGVDQIKRALLVMGTGGKGAAVSGAIATVASVSSLLADLVQTLNTINPELAATVGEMSRNLGVNLVRGASTAIEKTTEKLSEIPQVEQFFDVVDSIVNNPKLNEIAKGAASGLVSLAKGTASAAGNAVRGAGEIEYQKDENSEPVKVKDLITENLGKGAGFIRDSVSNLFGTPGGKPATGLLGTIEQLIKPIKVDPATVQQATEPIDPSVADMMQVNFENLLKSVFKDVSINFNKLKEAGKLPNLRVDEQNQLGGASGYSATANEIVIPTSIAQELQQSNIDKASVTTLVHEIRHAIQAGFGETSVSELVERIRAGKQSAVLPKEAGRSRIMMKGLANLKDKNFIDDVEYQVEDSVKAAKGVGTFSKKTELDALRVLETDAEVFARNYTDRIMGFSPNPAPDLPPELFRGKQQPEQKQKSNFESSTLLGQIAKLVIAYSETVDTGRTVLDAVANTKELISRLFGGKSATPRSDRGTAEIGSEAGQALEELIELVNRVLLSINTLNKSILSTHNPARVVAKPGKKEESTNAPRDSKKPQDYVADAMESLRDLLKIGQPVDETEKLINEIIKASKIKDPAIEQQVRDELNQLYRPENNQAYSETEAPRQTLQEIDLADIVASLPTYEKAAPVAALDEQKPRPALQEIDSLGAPSNSLLLIRPLQDLVKIGSDSFKVIGEIKKILSLFVRQQIKTATVVQPKSEPQVVVLADNALDAFLAKIQNVNEAPPKPETQKPVDPQGDFLDFMLSVGEVPGAETQTQSQTLFDDSNLLAAIDAVSNTLLELTAIAQTIAGINQTIVGLLENNETIDWGLSEDTLFRTRRRDEPPDEDRRPGESEAERMGRRYAEFANRNIERVVGMASTRLSDRGVSIEDQREIANQAGGFVFANLAAFFPQGALGVLVAPIAAAVSSFGIPIAAAVSQLTPLVQGMVETMQQISPIMNRLNSIGGSEERGQELFQFAKGISTQLNTPLLASVEGYSRLTAAAKGSRTEGEDTDTLFRGVSKASAALGLSSEDTSGIFLALQQVISKGKLAAEEIRGQIGERLPGTIQLLAESLDLSIGEFNRALDNGELLQSVVVPKLGKALDQKFTEAADRAANSFIGAINKIENTLFEFRLNFVKEFGGLVGGVASAMASVLKIVVDVFDKIILQSGVLFNALLGIQAFVLAGTFVIFKNLKIAEGLSKALIGQNAQIYKVLYPFLFGLVMEVLNQIIANALGVEIEGAITLITRAFSNGIGLAIQQIMSVMARPQDALEGLVLIGQSISLTYLEVGYTIRDAGLALAELFSLKMPRDFLSGFTAQLDAVDTRIKQTTLGALEKLSPQQQSQDGQQSGGLGSIFKGLGDEGKNITRVTLELIGLFLIFIQTGLLLKVIVDNLLAVTAALRTAAGVAIKTAFSFRFLDSSAKQATLGLKGLSLGLALLVAVLAYAIANSSLASDFLSESFNAVKALKAANKEIAALKDKSVKVEIDVVQKENGRDTPFQNKGVNLTFWRKKDREDIFTTDDWIRMRQKEVDDRSYRRNKPLIPEGFNANRGQLELPDNLQALRENIANPIANAQPINNLKDLKEVQRLLTQQQLSVEAELALDFKVARRGELKPLGALEAELKDANDVLETEGKKLEKNYLKYTKTLGEEAIKGFFPGPINYLQRQDPVLGGLARIPRILRDQNGEVTLDDLIGDGLRVDKIRKRRDQLIEELAKVKESSGSFGTSLISTKETEDQLGSLQKQIREIDRSLADLSTTTIDIGAPLPIRGIVDQPGNLAANQLSQQLERTTLEQPDVTRENLLKQRLRIEEQIAALRAKNPEVEALEAKRKELAQIIEDLRRIELFKANPAIFNNPFRQDDSQLRTAVERQVSYFPSLGFNVPTENLTTGLPKLVESVELERLRVDSEITLLSKQIREASEAGGDAAKELRGLNSELSKLRERSAKLTSLSTFLGTSQSILNTGTGRETFGDKGLESAILELSKALDSNFTRVLELQQNPTVNNLAKTEEFFLTEANRRNTRLTQIREERQNVVTTPQIPITQTGVTRAGLLTKEQKTELRGLTNQQGQLERLIAEANRANNEARANTSDPNLDIADTLDTYRKTQNELETLQKQLEEIKNLKNGIVKDAATLAPPIAVDPVAKTNRLAELDKQITQQEARVQEIQDQLALINLAKIDIGGDGGVGRAISNTVKDIRLVDVAWFDVITNLRNQIDKSLLSGYEKTITPNVQRISEKLQAQPQLDQLTTSATINALNSQDINATEKALKQFDFTANKIFLNGQEIEGTTAELKALKQNIIQTSDAIYKLKIVADRGTKTTQTAIQENLGLGDTSVTAQEETERLFNAATKLYSERVISKDQFESITKDGTTLREAEAAIRGLRDQGGQTNFQNILDRADSLGIDEEGRAELIKALSDLTDSIETIKGEDPKGGTIPFLGTFGELEYSDLISGSDEIEKEAFKLFNELDLAPFSLGVKGLKSMEEAALDYETALEKSSPVLSDIINQLRQIEADRVVMASRRAEIANAISGPNQRTDLTGEQRKALELEAIALDTQYRDLDRKRRKIAEPLFGTKEQVQKTITEIDKLIKKIQDSDLDIGIKEERITNLNRIKRERTDPLGKFFEYYDELITRSGEEQFQKANAKINATIQNLNTSLEAIERNSAVQQVRVRKIFADTGRDSGAIGTGTSAQTPIQSVESFDANLELNLAEDSFSSSLAAREQAAQSLVDLQKDYNDLVQASAASSGEVAQELKAQEAKLAEARAAYAEKEAAYLDNLTRLDQARVKLLRSQQASAAKAFDFNAKDAAIALKVKFNLGDISKVDLEKELASLDLQAIDFNLQLNAKAIEELNAMLDDGRISSVVEYKRALDELVSERQDLQTQKIDKQIEAENQAIERQTTLLQNQANLTGKRFDLAVASYQKLIDSANNYAKSLDLVDKAGEAIKSLFQSLAQSANSTGQGMLGVIDGLINGRKQLAEGELTGTERTRVTRRVEGLRQLGQSAGLNVTAADSEESLLQKQQKIATELARDKVEALRKEQALAAKLLAIELERNKIAADTAIQEAKINQLKAIQSVAIAEIELQKAAVEAQRSGDFAPLLLAQLEKQIAQLNLEGTGVEVEQAIQGKALQEALAGLQREQTKAEQGSQAEDLINEIAGNEQVDILALVPVLKGLRNFDPSKVSQTEVFKPVLDRLNATQARNDANKPIVGNLNGFEDFQAWADANIAQGDKAQPVANNLPILDSIAAFIANQDYYLDQARSQGDPGELINIAPPESGIVNGQATIATGLLDTLTPESTSANQSPMGTLVSVVGQILDTLRQLFTGSNPVIQPNPELTTPDITKQLQGLTNPTPQRELTNEEIKQFQNINNNQSINHGGTYQDNSTANRYSTISPNQLIGLQTPVAELSKPLESLAKAITFSEPVAASPQVDYRVPPGFQSNNGYKSTPSAGNSNTVNITNRIEVKDQKDLLKRAGELQAKAILDVLNKM